jgi:ABC-type multidrug transport system fused ATPase/permease subunit
MAVLVSVFSYLRTWLTVVAGVRASRDLHETALRRLLRAPMRFFDATPIGQLIQKFSSDFDQVFPTDSSRVAACHPIRSTSSCRAPSILSGG